MLNIFHQYATDPKAELEGKEFDWGGGAKLMIARSQNPKYQRMMAKLYEAHKHTLEQKDTPEQIAAAEKCYHEIMAEVMSHSVLMGWSGISGGQVDGKDVELPYSTAAAKKFLLLKDFQKAVAAKADEFKNYRFELEEADAKNLSPTSSGTSPGVEALTT